MKAYLIASLILNLLFGFLLIKNWKKRRTTQTQQISQNGPMGSGADLFKDITKSKELFKLLKREIHPEQFIDNPDLYKYAQEKMMQLGEISNSFTAMLKLVNEMKINNFPFSNKLEYLDNLK
jgi:hypothetical protein